MNRKILRIASSMLVFVLILGGYTPGQAAPQLLAPMPDQTINIVHFFKPPQNVDAARAVNYLSAFVLTSGDNAYRDQLMANGFSSTVPQYFRSDGIQNPGSCTATPVGNQVAYKPGDFCNISQNHPDWFLLDSSGRRITVTSGGEYYRMDPANPGWREFFLSRVMESQNQYGWAGLFLDNVEGSLSKFFGTRPARYPDDASYQAAIKGFLSFLDVNYSQMYDRPIIGNIVALDDEQVWFDYLQYLEGGMQERFAVAWSRTAYQSPAQWNEDLLQMERTQANGKYVLLVAPGNQLDFNRQTFAFASYLLISNGKAAFRYSNADSYRQAWIYENYRVDLGSPIGPRYLWGTIWRRDFTRGYVLVDPARFMAKISTSTSVPTQPPTFTDVPMIHRYWEDIEILSANGLTAGCTTTPLQFCPDQIMDRAQSAVFMLRGNFGINYTPPAETLHIFADNWALGEWAEKWAEGMFNAGLTSGCLSAPLRFCPWDRTPREQAAVFALKLKYGNNYIPPEATGSVFADMTDTNYYATKWVEKAYADGLIPACDIIDAASGKPNFCPRMLVTRGLAAHIIVRAKNLSMP